MRTIIGRLSAQTEKKQLLSLSIISKRLFDLSKEEVNEVFKVGSKSNNVELVKLCIYSMQFSNYGARQIASLMYNGWGQDCLEVGLMALINKGYDVEAMQEIRTLFQSDLYEFRNSDLVAYAVSQDKEVLGDSLIKAFEEGDSSTRGMMMNAMYKSAMTSKVVFDGFAKSRLEKKGTISLSLALSGMCSYTGKIDKGVLDELVNYIWELSEETPKLAESEKRLLCRIALQSDTAVELLEIISRTRDDEYLMESLNEFIAKGLLEKADNLGRLKSFFRKKIANTGGMKWGQYVNTCALAGWTDMLMDTLEKNAEFEYQVEYLLQKIEESM